MSGPAYVPPSSPFTDLAWSMSSPLAWADVSGSLTAQPAGFTRVKFAMSRSRSECRHVEKGVVEAVEVEARRIRDRVVHPRGQRAPQRAPHSRERALVPRARVRQRPRNLNDERARVVRPRGAAAPVDAARA